MRFSNWKQPLAGRLASRSRFGFDEKLGISRGYMKVGHGSLNKI